MATRFCMVVSNIWGFSAWNLLHITLLPPRISRWLLELGKICAPLADNIYVNFNVNYCSSQTIFISGSMLSYLEDTYIYFFFKGTLHKKKHDKNLPKIITCVQTNGNIKANVLNKLLPRVYKRTASKWKLLNISSPKEAAHNGRKWNIHRSISATQYTALG